MFFAKFPLKPKHFLGAVLGFSGATIIVATGPISLSAQHLRGYLLALAAALIWSTYSLLSKRLSASSAISPSCLLSGLLALLCHFVFEDRYLPSPTQAALVVVAGVGPMGLAFYLWDRAMKEGDPRIIGTLANFTPLFSTFLIAMLGYGKLGPTTLLSAVLILSGAALVSFRSRFQATEQPTQ